MLDFVLNACFDGVLWLVDAGVGNWGVVLQDKVAPLHSWISWSNERNFFPIVAQRALLACCGVVAVVGIEWNRLYVWLHSSLSGHVLDWTDLLLKLLQTMRATTISFC